MRPERVTTDGHGTSPRAIREILGSAVLHRCHPSLNNRLEQNHRGIKQRYYPMRGFGCFDSAARFCRAFDEVRQFFRFRTTMNQSVPLAGQREWFCQRLATLQARVAEVLTDKGLGREVPNSSCWFPLFSVLTHPVTADLDPDLLSHAQHNLYNGV
jgi:hypothetical protein